MQEIVSHIICNILFNICLQICCDQFIILTHNDKIFVLLKKLMQLVIVYESVKLLRTICCLHVFYCASCATVCVSKFNHLNSGTAINCFLVL